MFPSRNSQKQHASLEAIRAANNWSQTSFGPGHTVIWWLQVKDPDGNLLMDHKHIKINLWELVFVFSAHMDGDERQVTSSHFHILNLFSKIQNKENKFMYTNTSKIDYVLYKICTAAFRVKTSPICSFCPWWCSEGLTVGPGGGRMYEIIFGWETLKVRHVWRSTSYEQMTNWKECVKCNMWSQYHRILMVSFQNEAKLKRITEGVKLIFPPHCCTSLS